MKISTQRGSATLSHAAAYAHWRRAVAASLANAGPIVRTSAARGVPGNGLWDSYLAAFPEGPPRQEHNCSRCRAFIEAYGDLARVNDDGSLEPVFWGHASAEKLSSYLLVDQLLAARVRGARVTGAFFAQEAVLGTPVTGDWEHFHALVPAALMRSNAHAAEAAKREGFDQVIGAMRRYGAKRVLAVHDMLRFGGWSGAEQVLPQAAWLAGLARKEQELLDSRWRAVAWREVTAAPEGFLHPSSGLLGQLLDGSVTGLSASAIRRRFEALAAPDRYQRPQAAPSTGSVEVAEKLIASMGLERSLERRCARVEEVQALWRPRQTEESSGDKGGVFGHLITKGEKRPEPFVLPGVMMTWAKFARDMLPDAISLRAWLRSREHLGPLVTALHDDAPPILQWDSEENRNRFNWYTYRGGVPVSQFGVSEGWVDVDAVVLRPSQWAGEDRFQHLGKGVMLVLRGARESMQSGNGLFPAELRKELHGVRSVIEAFEKSATLHGVGEPHAAGLMRSLGNERWDLRLKVQLENGSCEVMVDRWE